MAIAVRDLEAAIDYYAETFGATVAHRERIESDGVEEALIKVADSYIQLLTPTSDSSPVAKYLEKKGEGIHHVGYRVADCGVALQAVKDHGGQIIDQAPRPGSRGTTVAFVHPENGLRHADRAGPGVGNTALDPQRVRTSEIAGRRSAPTCSDLVDPRTGRRSSPAGDGTIGASDICRPPDRPAGPAEVSEPTGAGDTASGLGDRAGRPGGSGDPGGRGGSGGRADRPR